MNARGSCSATSSSRWRRAGQLALLGMGVEPGLSDVFARYAADHLFSRIDELGVRDGADLRVEGCELFERMRSTVLFCGILPDLLIGGCRWLGSACSVAEGLVRWRAGFVGARS
jgi:hypothetical protein